MSLLLLLILLMPHDFKQNLTNPLDYNPIFFNQMLFKLLEHTEIIVTTVDYFRDAH